MKSPYETGIRGIKDCRSFVELEGSQALHVNVKSFNLLRAITDTNFFSKVALSPTARLIIFSLANMYNPKKGFVYPKNNKLMKCTGAGERAVSQAISELKEKGLVVIVFEENFRKIYFTQKTYEVLGIVENDLEEAKSPQNEFVLKKDCVEAEKEKIAGRVAKKWGGVAKNAPTCHEQKKEQIRKQFVDLEKDLRFKSERDEVKEAFSKESYLTNKMQAEIIMEGFHRYNVKGDSDFKAILRIKKVWNFKNEDFDVLRFVEEKKKNDMIFARKIEKIENEVEFSFLGFEKEIEELRFSWQDYGH